MHGVGGETAKKVSSILILSKSLILTAAQRAASYNRLCLLYDQELVLFRIYLAALFKIGAFFFRDVYFRSFGEVVTIKILFL